MADPGRTCGTAGLYLLPLYCCLTLPCAPEGDASTEYCGCWCAGSDQGFCAAALMRACSRCHSALRARSWAAARAASSSPMPSCEGGVGDGAQVMQRRRVSERVAGVWGERAGGAEGSGT